MVSGNGDATGNKDINIFWNTDIFPFSSPKLWSISLYLFGAMATAGDRQLSSRFSARSCVLLKKTKSFNHLSQKMCSMKIPKSFNHLSQRLCSMKIPKANHHDDDRYYLKSSNWYCLDWPGLRIRCLKLQTSFCNMRVSVTRTKTIWMARFGLTTKQQKTKDEQQ